MYLSLIHTPIAGVFTSLVVQQMTIICAAVAIFFLVWCIIKRIFRWIGTEDGRFFKRRIRPIKLQEQELLNAEEITKLSATLTSTVRRLVNIFLLSALTVIILTQFKSSRHIPKKVWEYLADKGLELQKEFLEFIPNLVFILLVAFVVNFLIRIVRLIFDGLEC